MDGRPRPWTQGCERRVFSVTACQLHARIDQVVATKSNVTDAMSQEQVLAAALALPPESRIELAEF
jgi:hypothetical protein